MLSNLVGFHRVLCSLFSLGGLGMSKESAKKVIADYRRRFEVARYPKHSSSGHLDQINSGLRAISHCYFMLDAIESLIDYGKLDEAVRSFRFVQGVTWVEFGFCLQDLEGQINSMLE